MKTANLHKPLFHVLLIILLSLLAYSNTFHASFHLDDIPVIDTNPLIKNLQFFIEPSKAKVFNDHFGYDTFKRRYIGYLTFALNYKLHGLDVTGYHIVNLFIHISTALLVYLLVILSFKTPFLRESPIKDYSRHIAVFTALLFACHPIQTQAITYIWQRVTSLATMLYVLSLVAYVKWRLGGQSTEHRAQSTDKTKTNFSLKSFLLYALSIICAVLAMKTKETAFMLPLTITLYEFLFFQGKIRKRIIYVVPLLLTMLIVPLTLISIDRPLGELIGDVSEVTRGHTSLSRWEYLFTSFRVIVTYIRLLFLPIHQNLDYNYPKYNSFFDIEVFVSFLFLLSIFGLGVYLFYRYRHTASHTRLISFGITWFFINLVLESSIIPLNNVIFEHRVYLSSIGVFLLISTSLFIGVEKLKGRWKNIEVAIVWALVIIIVVLTGTTYARNRVWIDEESMWEDVVKKSPNKSRAHNNLGLAYESQGRIDKAIEQYLIAIKLSPYFSLAHNNLGLAYESQGLIDKAIEQYLIAIKLNPNSSQAHNNLGLAYESQGLIDKAMEQYLIAIKLNPNSSQAHNNLGLAYESQGLIDKAMEQYLIAVELNPSSPQAHNNLGIAYYSQGDIDKAIKHHLIAIKLNPEWVMPRFNLGIIYLKKGDIEKAHGEFEKVLQINPQHHEARKLLNLIITSP